MELSEKIKFFRSLKGWTQEILAEKLGISTYAYSKIERGETDVNFSRLQQISEVMDVKLTKLLDFDEKSIFNLTGNHNTQCEKIDNNWNIASNSSAKQKKYQHELEKAQLINKQFQIEIAYLKQQVIDLREMNNMLKNK